MSGERNLGVVVIEDLSSEEAPLVLLFSMWILDVLVVQRASLSRPRIMASGTRICWNSVGEAAVISAVTEGNIFLLT